MSNTQLADSKKRTAKRSRRLQTLWALVVASALVLPLAWLGYRNSVKSVEAETLQEANDGLNQALAAFLYEDFAAPANVWTANVEEGWFTPVGDEWLEPPILSLAEGVLNDEEIVRYSFVNGDFLSVGRWIDEESVLITVVERDQESSALRRVLLKWLALALLAPIGVALLAWQSLGRMRGPEEAAHTVNREFIADAAHELRTPLSIIQASAGHALARDREADAYRESLEEILEATERAGASVGELLEFARLESGQASPRLAPLRLDLLVEEVANSIRIDDVEVKAIPGEAIVVEADYNLIRQVVDNITRNATARASKVVLTTYQDDNEARIEISDNGPGFDEGVLAHVFERFRRGDRSGGVGLGMAIARTIVELHGGTCEAANRKAADSKTGETGKTGKTDAAGEEDSASSGALVTVRLPLAK